MPLKTLVLRLLFLVALVGATGPLAAQATGKDAKPKSAGPLELVLTGEETGTQLEKLLSSAGKDGRQVVVRIQPPAKATDADDDEKDELAGLIQMVDKGTSRGLNGIFKLAEIPHLVQANINRVTADWHADLLTLIPVPILVGLLVGGLLLRILRRLRPDCSTDDDVTLTSRVLNGLVRLAIDLAAFAAYRVTSYFIGKLLLGLSGPYFDAMMSLNFGVSHVLVYGIGAHVMLYPYANGQRLVPLPNGAHHFRMLMAFSVFSPIMHFGTSLITLFGGGSDQITGWIMFFSSVATVFKIWWFWTARKDLAALVMFGAPEGSRITPMRRAMANSVAPVFVLSAIFIWVVARAAAVAPAGMQWGAAGNVTQFYVIFVPLLVTGAGGLAREWFDNNPSARGTPMENALRETSVAGIASVVWVLATLDLGRIWSQFLSANMGEAGLGVLRGLITAAITGVMGLLIWIFLKTLFDGYLPKQKSGLPGLDDDADDGEPNIQSRMSSILPVIRGIALVVVVALTVLFILSKLGLDTGPLLAGFGIMGLALSFGSQALVRDVVSGIFFLADDAFRVGEYIDTGRLKGTVERITLRAVQLRHQSGLVHTIPYGQLQAVTNASRDWATVKFPIRLDHRADIEKTRKIIKKIGQDLLNHEEFGSDFFMPVKFQGIQEIQDNAIVARIKFTAKPFRTSQIQREALKRIYLGLTEAGVPLATNSVNVRGGSPEAAAAAFANANATLPPPAAAAAG